MLFARHPEMATWPRDHGFLPYELEVGEVHLLDYFGGVHVVSREAYFAADPPAAAAAAVGASAPAGEGEAGGAGAALAAPAAS